MSSALGTRLVRHITLGLRFLMLGALLAACGGGGGVGDEPQPPPPAPAQARIAAFAGSLPDLSTGAGDLGGAGNQDGDASQARFLKPAGVAVDAAGNVYVADEGNHNIRKISPAGVVSTLAGLARVSGYIDGSGSDARFAYPSDVAVDGAGNVYVADSYNHAIRKITPAGVVSTVAGRAAGLAEPRGVTVDGLGNLYVADWGNVVFRITPSGTVSILASGLPRPVGIALDPAGNVLVSDLFQIRRITPAGAVSVVAGNPSVRGSADGTGEAAQFQGPWGIDVDRGGNIYVADAGNSTIRRITPAGVVSTLAGSPGVSGSADGSGSAARFYGPRGVATDSAGNIYVADAANYMIRKVTPGGVVSTVAGSARLSGSADGIGSTAMFNLPKGVAADSAGSIYVTDGYNHTVRRITPDAAVTTLAGSAGSAGYADGGGQQARFHYPSAVAVDRAGTAYVVDALNMKVRRITPAGTVSTLAGSGTLGSADGEGAAASFRFCGPVMCYCHLSSCSATEAICYPIGCEDSAPGIATDAGGTVYVADSLNHAVRKITPAGLVSTLAGRPAVSGSADGSGADARFSMPSGLAIDSAGNVFVADASNHTIRRITPAGTVSTVAGSPGVSGAVDGRGPDARFNRPRGIAIDAAGTLYVADFDNNTIRRIDPDGVVTTLAGEAGVKGFRSGPLPGVVGSPWGVAVSGRKLYVTLYNGIAVVDLP